MMGDKTYGEHPVFSKLGKYSSFYEGLGDSTMFFLAQGTHGFIGMDSYAFSSMQATVESIKAVLEKGRIGDAYALLRKYFDAAIISIYTNLYLEDNFSIDNFIVEKIENWRSGKEKLPEIRKMNNYIRASPKMKVVNDLLYKDKRYSQIRDRCNNHTHYNSYFYLVLNDGNIHVQNREVYFDRISNDLEAILILHASCLFCLSDHYMMSSDYRDSMDMGMTPEPGSEYFVAPFIQEMFDEVISKSRPDIALAIKSKTAMNLT